MDATSFINLSSNMTNYAIFFFIFEWIKNNPKKVEP